MHGISIFRNDVLYEFRQPGECYYIEQITIPLDVEDTEKAFIEYAMPTIKEMAKKEGITDELVLVKGAKIKNTDVVIEDGYTIKSIRGDELGYIVLKKETISSSQSEESITLVDENSKIKLVAKENVVPKNTIVVVKEVETMYHKELNKYWGKYFAYDITLQSNGVAIQPNGKVRISIPIPNYFDATKLVVYRVTSTGEKIKYDITVEGDFAVIETDHFSVYVLAEEINRGTELVSVVHGEYNQAQAGNILDKEPKTGTENYKELATILALVSLMWIIKRGLNET